MELVYPVEPKPVCVFAWVLVFPNEKPPPVAIIIRWFTLKVKTKTSASANEIIKASVNYNFTVTQSSSLKAVAVINYVLDI